MCKAVERAGSVRVAAAVFTFIIVAAAAPTPALAQEDTAAAEAAGDTLDIPQVPSLEEWPEADPADVATPDAIVDAVYEVISGGPGVDRDWDRLFSLFRPGAHLMPARGEAAAAPGIRHLDAYGIQEWLDASAPYLTQSGFWEREISGVTERFGNVAHAFSTYDSRIQTEGSEPVARGINSFQLVREEGRWWITGIVWDWENPQQPIPQKYLSENAEPADRDDAQSGGEEGG